MQDPASANKLVTSFLEERCATDDPDARTPISDLRREFDEYLLEQGLPLIPSYHFLRALKQLGFEVQLVRVAGSQPRTQRACAGVRVVWDPRLPDL